MSSMAAETMSTAITPPPSASDGENCRLRWALKERPCHEEVIGRQSESDGPNVNWELRRESIGLTVQSSYPPSDAR
jgi:hypothetical protein